MARKRIPRSQLSPDELAAARAKDHARYERNRETILANDRKSYQKHAAKILARHKQHREANHDATLLAQRGYAKAYRARHHARILELEQASRKRNKVARALGRKRYAQTNAGRIKNKEDIARRRARIAAAPINDFTAEQWEALCKTVRYRCCYCGGKGTAETLQPDHLTPYNDKGSNTLHNILPCCGPCNYRKKDRAVLKPVQPFLLIDEGAAD